MNACQKGLPLDNGLLQIKKPIWTVGDLMEITGYRKQTIYNKVNSKEIPHRKKGGRLFFFPDEIINWIDEGDME